MTNSQYQIEIFGTGSSSHGETYGYAIYRVYTDTDGIEIREKCATDSRFGKKSSAIHHAKEAIKWLERKRKINVYEAPKNDMH